MTDTASPETTEASSGRSRWLALVPLALFAALGIVFYIALQTGDPSKLPSALIGKPVPQFTLAGVPGLTSGGAPVPGFATADLAKGEVALVNVFASWCGPCREEQAVLNQAGQRLKTPLYGINYKDNAADAARFLGQYGNPFSRIGADVSGRTAIDWGVYGVPETYVIDGQGRIAYKVVGPLTPDMVESELRPAVEKARKGG